VIGIIGGGPAGLFAAGKIGECVVFEEDSVIGEPVRCGGLISRDGLEKLGVLDKNYVLNRVKGARFFCGNESFEVRGGENKAVVVDRRRFDQYLAGRAEKAGAEIKRGCRVREARKNGKFRVLANKWYDFEKLVLACGYSLLPEQVGLPAYPKERLLKCMQAEVEVEGVDADFVELHFSNEFARGFFGWMIPCGDGTARVGVGSMENPVVGFGEFLERFGAEPVSGFGAERVNSLGAALRRGGDAEMRPASPANCFGAVIPIEGPLDTTENNGAFLLGDAAGQVKPTTGGGVVMGMKCAQVLAESMDGGYDAAWRQEIGHELELGLVIRKVWNGLDDAKRERVFRLVRERGLDKLIGEHGHMDNPSSLMGKVNIGELIKEVSGR